MPKDMPVPLEIDDLTPEELARLESRLFCAGGPPKTLDARLMRLAMPVRTAY